MRFDGSSFAENVSGESQSAFLVIIQRVSFPCGQGQVRSIGPVVEGRVSMGRGGLCGLRRLQPAPATKRSPPACRHAPCRSRGTKDLSKINSVSCGAAVSAAPAGGTPAPQVVLGQALTASSTTGQGGCMMPVVAGSGGCAGAPRWEMPEDDVYELGLSV